MLQFASEIKKVHPDIFIHSIYLEEDLDQDRRAGFVFIFPFLICISSD